VGEGRREGEGRGRGRGRGARQSPCATGAACCAPTYLVLRPLVPASLAQVGLSCAQLLVTENDFLNVGFREQLRSTVDSLLEHRVVPVFNENDAISTRTAPYKVSVW